MNTDATKCLSVLLVDDHSLFRQSVAHYLDAQPGFQVSQCGSVAEAMELLAQKPPSLILLDHDLGGERAINFIPEARALGYLGAVLVVTAGLQMAEARRLLQQGASGIFLKKDSPEQLMEAIQVVTAGGTSLDPSFAGLTGDHATRSTATPATPFSERQLRVLRFVVEGLSNKEIAWRMEISESYVKALLQRLFQITGVRTRGQLVRITFEQYSDLL